MGWEFSPGWGAPRRDPRSHWESETPETGALRPAERLEVLAGHCPGGSGAGVSCSRSGPWGSRLRGGKSVAPRGPGADPQLPAQAR